MAKILTVDNPKIFPLAALVRTLATPRDRDLLLARMTAEMRVKPAQRARPVTLYAVGKLCRPKGLSFLQRLVLRDPDYRVRRNAVIGLRLCPHPSSNKAVLDLLEYLIDKTCANEWVALPRFRDHAPGLLTQCFDLLDESKDYTGTRDRMVRLMAKKPLGRLDKRNRNRMMLIQILAAKELIAMGKVAGLKQVLAGFPVGQTFPLPYLNLIVLAVRDTSGVPSRPEYLSVLRTALRSRKWLVRLIAIETLARVGDKRVDPKLLKKLVRDRTRVRGWSRQVTVGQRAAKAIQVLRNR